MQRVSLEIYHSISDHLAMFLIIPIEFKYDDRKETLFKQDFKYFDRENNFLDLLDIEWKSIINIEKGTPTFHLMSMKKH